jgi:hypothetical protein
MGKSDVDKEQLIAQFNQFALRYNARPFFVAERFSERSDDWERLSCEFYARYGFVFTEGAESAIEEMLKEPVILLSELAMHLYDSWSFTSHQAERQGETKILPPNSQPPPTVPAQPRPQESQIGEEWKQRGRVLVGILRLVKLPVGLVFGVGAVGFLVVVIQLIQMMMDN